MYRPSDAIKGGKCCLEAEVLAQRGLGLAQAGTDLGVDASSSGSAIGLSGRRHGSVRRCDNIAPGGLWFGHPLRGNTPPDERMPSARKELLGSANSYARSGENRLTELVATVLQIHDGFAGELMRSVGLPVGERFEVKTQQRVAPGCVPDLVVKSLRTSGGVVSQLWAEHKTVSGFRHEQREDYRRALAAEPGVGQLLTVTVEHKADDLGDWRRMTWQELAELLDGVGRSEGGPRWRENALRPDAPARDRLLHELLWYLEEEGFAVVRPLSADDLRVLQHFVETMDVAEALLERAAEHMQGLIRDSADNEDDSWWFHVEPPAGAWIRRLAPFEAYCEVLLCGDDHWWPESTGEPAVGAGYTLDPQLHAALSADSDWVDRLEEAGYTLGEWGGYVRCWRTLPLGTLVDAGATLDAQARQLATWARESIDALSQFEPKRLEVPEPRKGGRSRKAEPSEPA